MEAVTATHKAIHDRDGALTCVWVCNAEYLSWFMDFNNVKIQGSGEERPRVIRSLSVGVKPGVCLGKLAS